MFIETMHVYTYVRVCEHASVCGECVGVCAYVSCVCLRETVC